MIDPNDGSEWGEFDVSRMDEDFVTWADHNMWPYVKLYSFADNLKAICIGYLTFRSTVYMELARKKIAHKNICYGKIFRACL